MRIAGLAVALAHLWARPSLWGPVRTTLMVGLIALAVLVIPATTFAQARAQRIDSARAARLHGLAADILPAPERPTASPGDVRELRSELELLSQWIVEVELDPSEASLASLASRRRTAEAALSHLCERMKTRGALEHAEDLAREFAPLWGELDGALGSSSARRSQRLTEASRILRQGTRRSRNAHSTGFGGLPLVQGR
jgi:hypothetical protein